MNGGRGEPIQPRSNNKHDRKRHREKWKEQQRCLLCMKVQVCFQHLFRSEREHEIRRELEFDVQQVSKCTQEFRVVQQ